MKWLLFPLLLTLVCSTARADWLQDQIARTIEANRVLLDRLDNRLSEGEDLEDVIEPLKRSIGLQTKLFEALRQQDEKDGTITVMHPQFNLPVRTRSVTVWYRPGHSGRILVGETWFSDGKYPIWDNVSIPASVQPQATERTPQTPERIRELMRQ